MTQLGLFDDYLAQRFWCPDCSRDFPFVLEDRRCRNNRIHRPDLLDALQAIRESLAGKSGSSYYPDHDRITILIRHAHVIYALISRQLEEAS